MPVSMPAIRPPDRPPTSTPIIVASPCVALMPNVKGSVSTTAIVIVKPGIAPVIRPAATPIIIRPIVFNSKTALVAAITFSNITGGP